MGSLNVFFHYGKKVEDWLTCQDSHKPEKTYMERLGWQGVQGYNIRSQHKLDGPFVVSSQPISMVPDAMTWYN